MKKILFVCTGNTCRSPMAEAILQSKNLSQVEVRSAGVYAIDGDDASNHAQSVLKTKNMYFDHESRRVTRELLNWATYIFTMTEGHKKSIIMEYPDFTYKLFTLKEFVGESSLDVADPYGGTENDYLVTFSELEKMIEKLIQKLE